jgi:hypothetical protein
MPQPTPTPPTRRAGRLPASYSDPDVFDHDPDCREAAPARARWREILREQGVHLGHAYDEEPQ